MNNAIEFLGNLFSLLLALGLILLVLTGLTGGDNKPPTATGAIFLTLTQYCATVWLGCLLLAALLRFCQWILRME